MKRKIKFGHMYSKNRFCKQHGHDFFLQVITFPLHQIVWFHGEGDSLFKVFKQKGGK